MTFLIVIPHLISLALDTYCLSSKRKGELISGSTVYKEKRICCFFFPFIYHFNVKYHFSGFTAFLV